MPDSQDLQRAADVLRGYLGDQEFLTLARSQISDVVRQASGDERTRLKARMSAELEKKLLHDGVRCYPLLEDTDEQFIRIFRTRSRLAALVDSIVEPAGKDQILSRWLDALPNADDRREW